MPTTFDVVLLISSICGLVMVLGGIVLLYKGAIKLSDVPRNTKDKNESSLTVEFKEYLKLTVHYPALALFVIGLAFTSYSILESKSVAVRIINFSGETIRAEDAKALVRWQKHLLVGSNGKIVDVIRPNLDVLMVVHSAPGYKTQAEPIPPEDLKSGFVTITAPVPEKVQEKPPLNKENIASLPEGFSSPAFEG